MASKEELNNVVVLFDPLIHHILHHYHFSSYHNDYQDHLQEMRLHLLDLYQKFEGDPLSNLDHRYQFVAYAKRGLRWFFLNRLRKRKCQVSTTDPLILNQLVDQEAACLSDSDAFLLQESAKRYLKGRELDVFNLLASDCWLNQEICHILHISQRTLRNDKKRIVQRLSRGLKFLANFFVF